MLFWPPVKKQLLLLMLVFAAIGAAVFGWQRARASHGAHAEAAVQRWACPMRCLNKVYDHPGDCPVCHMKLVPLAARSAAPAAPTPEAAPAEANGGGAGQFSAHGHGKKAAEAPKPLGYRCPLRYSQTRFDAPGRCPFCTLPLKPYYAPGQAPPRAVSQRAPWPDVAGRTAVYFRPYVVRPVAVDRTLRLAGTVSADRWHLRAPLPAGEPAPPRHALAMLTPGGGGRPVLAELMGVSGGSLDLKASRKLDGVAFATAELQLAGPTVLAVPVEAVLESEGQAHVYRQKGDGFEPVALKLGRRGERFVEVLDGLKDGDLIAGAGVFWVEAQWRLDHPGEAL